MSREGLRQKLVALLKEPDISCCDWALAVQILSQWKAELPDATLAIPGLAIVDERKTFKGAMENRVGYMFCGYKDDYRSWRKVTLVKDLK